MENNKSSTDTQTSIPIYHDEYHTVPIRSDLPEIPKYYQEEPLQHLPPNEFWMKKLDSSYDYQESSSSTPNHTIRYEVQFSTINGPCKLIIIKVTSYEILI